MDDGLFIVVVYVRFSGVVMFFYWDIVGEWVCL